MRKRDIPEPWMFGTEVTVNGQAMRPTIHRFTLRARLRMALRTLRGKPAMNGTLIEPLP